MPINDGGKGIGTSGNEDGSGSAWEVGGNGSGDDNDGMAPRRGALG